MSKKGIKPNMNGTPGIMLSIDSIPKDLQFGRNKESPYDKLIFQLKQAGKDHCLRFEDIKARAAIYSRSKKLGIELEFAFNENILFVKLKQPKLNTSDEKELKQGENEVYVFKAIKAGYKTPEIIAKYIRDQGKSSMDSSMVQIIAKRMTEKGQLIFKGDSLRQSWELS